MFFLLSHKSTQETHKFFTEVYQAFGVFFQGAERIYTVLPSILLVHRSESVFLLFNNKKIKRRFPCLSGLIISKHFGVVRKEKTVLRPTGEKEFSFFYKIIRFYSFICFFFFVCRFVTKIGLPVAWLHNPLHHRDSCFPPSKVICLIKNPTFYCALIKILFAFCWKEGGYRSNKSLSRRAMTRCFMQGHCSPLQLQLQFLLFTFFFDRPLADLSTSMIRRRRYECHSLKVIPYRLVIEENDSISTDSSFLVFFAHNSLSLGEVRI